MIGDDAFPASLLDLPCVVESYKTYDDNVLIKTADVGQVITCFSSHLLHKIPTFFNIIRRCQSIGLFALSFDVAVIFRFILFFQGFHYVKYIL